MVKERKHIQIHRDRRWEKESKKGISTPPRGIWGINADGRRKMPGKELPGLGVPIAKQIWKRRAKIVRESD